MGVASHRKPQILSRPPTTSTRIASPAREIRRLKKGSDRRPDSHIIISRCQVCSYKVPRQPSQSNAITPVRKPLPALVPPRCAGQILRPDLFSRLPRNRGERMRVWWTTNVQSALRRPATKAGISGTRAWTSCWPIRSVARPGEDGGEVSPAIGSLSWKCTLPAADAPCYKVTRSLAQPRGTQRRVPLVIPNPRLPFFPPISSPAATTCASLVGLGEALSYRSPAKRIGNMTPMDSARQPFSGDASQSAFP
jgi:hypothetical protein